MISFAAITPHPPIMVPGIGFGADLKAVAKSIAAMETLRTELESLKPETIVVISPHAPLEYDSFGINSARSLSGDLLNFGLDKNFLFENDPELRDKIFEAGGKKGISVHKHEAMLDHGVLVPLYYLTKNIKPKLVHLSFSLLDLHRHFDYGKMISRIIAADEKKIAVIASGDLSHRLTKGAPAGFAPEGEVFDSRVMEFLEKGKSSSVLKLDPVFTEAAGECGLRSIAILLGVLDGKKCKFEKLSYEGPFGVGYLVAEFKI